MHSDNALIRLSGCFLIPFLVVLSGCSSTPRHTNTLIFGTNTKVAFDISQDATGIVGLTLGYKRQEAVWMPLLANGDAKGSPQSCNNDDCKRFIASVGKGGSIGEGSIDTYSVLATFKGKAGAGTADGNKGKEGVLTQYFATGFAARLLAASGASVVNAGSTVTPAAAISAAHAEQNTHLIQEQRTKIDRIMFAITTKDGELNKKKRDDLVNSAGFSNDSPIKRELLRHPTARDIREQLEFTFPISGQPLFDALD